MKLTKESQNEKINISYNLNNRFNASFSNERLFLLQKV